MVASYYSQSAPSQVRFWLGRAQYYVMLRILTFVRALGYISSYLFHASLDCWVREYTLSWLYSCIMLNKMAKSQRGRLVEGERGGWGEGEMGRGGDGRGFEPFGTVQVKNTKIQFKGPTAFQYPEYEVTDIDEPAPTDND
ncbi:hypothetical protein QUB47_01855 [Microcoleus sp. AT9_B5]